MVVATRAYEEGARHVRGDVEPQYCVVKVLGLRNIAHFQVDVPDGYRRRHRGHRLERRLREQVVEIQRQRHELELAAGRVAPLLARAIGIDLDPQAVGVAEVQRLGDAVIGRAVDRPARGHDALHARRQRRTRGVQPGDVIQPGAVGIGGHGVGQALQLEQRAVLVASE